FYTCKALFTSRLPRRLHDLALAAIAGLCAAPGPGYDELQVVRRRGGREVLVLEPIYDDLVARCEIDRHVENQGLAPILVAHNRQDLARRDPRDRGGGERRVPGH